MVWQLVYLLLLLIAGLVGSFAPYQPYAAWYLNNAEDFGDWGASCSDAWYSDYKKFATFGLILRWVFYVVAVAIVSHMTWTAHLTRKYMLEPEDASVKPAVATATAVATPAVATATAVATPAVAVATATAATPAGSSDPMAA